MTDNKIEQEIKSKGLAAPRITPADIQGNIKSVWFFTGRECAIGSTYDMSLFPESLGLLTFCALVLQNGFTVTGESACASPENYDYELGKKIARQNAEAKIWPLMGYELRTRLSE